VRIALVSPYSWSYPGGVTRHIEALAGSPARLGHTGERHHAVRPQDPLSARLHRGALPQARQLDETWSPSGGPSASRQRRGVEPRDRTVRRLGGSRSAGARGYDVVHVTSDRPGDQLGRPLLLPSAARRHLPLLFDERPENGFGNLAGASRRMNRLAVRIAVSEAAA